MTRRPHYPPAQPLDPQSPLGRALRDGHPTVPGLFDQQTATQEAVHQFGEALGTAAVIRARLTDALVDGVMTGLAGPGQTGNEHPETSHTAGHTDQGTARARILDAIIASNRGMTSHEVVEAELAPNTNIAGARLQELRGERSGWPPLVAWIVSDAGKYATRKHDGRTARVHVALGATLGRGWHFAEPRATARPTRPGRSLIEVEHVTDPRALAVGDVLVHMATRAVFTISGRKGDDSGWWSAFRAGVADWMIERGDWQLLVRP